MKAAIYSRKSRFTGKGESVENQIQLCKEYLNHMQVEDFLVYEDEGFSGSNTDRPQFKQMITDAKSKKFDILICYRLDRISRNIADFSSLIEELQKYSISFISIREQFDTSTPMGRAMMYIASVFAQLERETIAERIKDNMLELAKSGHWLGGQTPLGFESKSVIYISDDFKQKKMYQLSPVAEELNIVIKIYEKYLETHSLSRTLKYLFANSIKGKKGGDFGITSLKDILRNPVYVKSDASVFEYLLKKGMNTCGNPSGKGILVYNKKNSKYKSRDISEWYAATSNHNGVIDSSKWLEAQSIMDKNKNQSKQRLGTSKTALLTGLLKCSHCESPMRVSYGRVNNKTGIKTYYYTCIMKCNSGKTRCNNPNVKGSEIENYVLKSIEKINKASLLGELQAYREEAASTIDKSHISDLKNELQLKNKQMDSLLIKLAEIENPIASEYIISKVESLGSEIKELEMKLNNLEHIKTEAINKQLNIDILIDALNSLSTTIHLIPDINKKKLLLETIIDSIFWDGETGEVTINLWGAKKN